MVDREDLYQGIVVGVDVGYLRGNVGTIITEDFNNEPFIYEVEFWDKRFNEYYTEWFSEEQINIYQEPEELDYYKEKRELELGGNS